MISIIMFLITTADERTWKFDDKIIYLGEWCKLYSRKHVWSHLDYEVMPYHWDDRDRMSRDYQYLSNVYDKYLKALSDILNDVHSRDYSIRYWRIVIGPWLRYFTDAIYDRYQSIKSIANSGKITSTWILKSDISSWIPMNFINFYSAFTADQWNHFIYGEIIKSFGDVPYSIIDENNLAKYPCDGKSKVSILSFIKKNTINSYTRCIPKRFNNIIFISSYFSRLIDLMKLQFSLRQLPFPSGPCVAIPHFKCDISLRRKLKIDLATNQFEQILEILIPLQMPACYFEGYSLTSKLVSLKYPKNAKAIFTANAYSHDDAFKIWAAEKVESGTKLLIGQHGGNFGAALCAQDEDHQISICDKFYSWGWSSDSTTKVKPLPAGKLISLKTGVPCDNSGPILMVLGSFPRYFYFSLSVPAASQTLNYINDQITFIRAISKNAFDLLRIRLAPSEFGWCMESRFVHAGFANLVDKTGIKLFKRLKECRLCVCTHSATVMLETFAANYPTVLFWNPRYYELRPEAKPYYEKLHEAGILHYDSISAAQAVNEIYDDPSGWWQQGHIQDAKDTFCERFAYTGDNWLKEWKRELMPSVSKHHHP